MYTNLQYVGHFRDKKLITKFKQEFSKSEILYEIRKNQPNHDQRISTEELQGKCQAEDNRFYLFAEREKYPEALKIYQSILGIGRPIGPNKADQEWIKIKDLPVGKVGQFSIGFSIILFIFYKIPNYKNFFDLLFIGDSKSALFKQIIDYGQVWRLVTPAFMHFSFLHIIMNALWLRELSRILEDHYSGVRFFTYFLTIIITSNVCQYLMKGPMFGGLSGVVYGLLGVLWVKKSLDKDFPFMLPKRDIYLMIGWFFLCLTGLVGNIANTAHGVGLAMGMGLALFELAPKLIKSKKDNVLILILKWFGYILGILFATIFAEVAWSAVNQVPLFYKIHT